MKVKNPNYSEFGDSAEFIIPSVFIMKTKFPHSTIIFTDYCEMLKYLDKIHPQSFSVETFHTCIPR